MGKCNEREREIPQPTAKSKGIKARYTVGCVGGDVRRRRGLVDASTDSVQANYLQFNQRRLVIQFSPLASIVKVTEKVLDLSSIALDNQG